MSSSQLLEILRHFRSNIFLIILDYPIDIDVTLKNLFHMDLFINDVTFFCGESQGLQRQYEILVWQREIGLGLKSMPDEMKQSASEIWTSWTWLNLDMVARFLGSSQFLLMFQLHQKMRVTSKVVKSDSKKIISLS